MQTLLHERVLGKLRWRCRRGLLENDLLIERFFERRAARLTQRQADALMALMELPDPDLLDLLLGRTEPPAGLCPPGSAGEQVLRMLRAPRAGSAFQSTTVKERP